MSWMLSQKGLLRVTIIVSKQIIIFKCTSRIQAAIGASGIWLFIRLFRLFNRDPCPHGKQILCTPDQTYIRCGLECSEPKAIPWQPGMTSQAQQGPMPSPFLQPSNSPPWIKMMYLETFHHATFKHSIEINIGRHLLVPCCTRPGWHCTMDTGRVKIWSVAIIMMFWPT